MEINAIEIDFNTTLKNQTAYPIGTTAQGLRQQKEPTYYRSKAFVSQVGINPLIAAAAPLFFLIEKIQNLKTSPDLNQLCDDLLHEMKAFETQAQHQGYRPKMLSAARYALCVWIDEIIARTEWGRQTHWQLQDLIDNENAEKPENRSFFLLLTHCLQDPQKYLDLLELLYVCLSLGYEGEYRFMERGYILLAEIRDNLYHSILRNRPATSKQLEIAAPQTAVQERNLPKLLTRCLFIAAISTVFISSLITTNLQLNHQLNLTNNFLEQNSLAESAS